MKKRRILAGLLTAAMLVGVSLAEYAPATAAETEENLKYFVDDSEVTITGLKEEEGVKSVTIPKTIDGYPVTAINYGAFQYTRIRSITLPAKLKTIGGSAFYNCEYLKSVSIPANVSEIGGSAFYGCDRLKKVVFRGKRLAEIDYQTFGFCKRLESIRIPDSVREIGSHAFYRCTKLSRVILSSSLRSIGDSAFREDYALSSVRIPKNVSEIGENAFSKCTGLKTVSFRGKKTTFGWGAFSSCRMLTAVAIPSGMTEVPENSFNDCTALKKVTLPKGTKLIKKCAFAGCRNLKSIRFTEKIYGIGDQAFDGSGLIRVKLNKALKYIGNGAFRNTALRRVKLPGKVTFIGNRVFMNCNRMKSISIPASVRGLNPGALGGCTSLKKIKVAKGNKNYSSSDGVLFDKGMTKLIQYPLAKKSKSYYVPSTVVTIRARAFENNDHLKKVSVGAAYIHRAAFSQMDKLQTIELRSGVKKIDRDVFYEDAALKNVSIPDSVIKIGDYAFGKSGITSVHIPRSIRELSHKAFYQCYGIKEFTGSAYGKTRVIDGVLYGAYGKTLLTYPSKKKDKSFTVPGTVTKVAAYAMSRVKHLKSLYFEAGIKVLAYNAVNNCNRLKQVVFDNAVKITSCYGGIRDCGRLAVIVGPKDYALSSLAENAGATMITL